MGQFSLDKLDLQILSMIAENARIPFLEVARACNVSGAAIHQRIQKLTRMGLIKSAQFQFDPEIGGDIRRSVVIDRIVDGFHNAFFK